VGHLRDYPNLFRRPDSCTTFAFSETAPETACSIALWLLLCDKVLCNKAAQGDLSLWKEELFPF
jgi:hypothetical protein